MELNKLAAALISVIGLMSPAHSQDSAFSVVEIIASDSNIISFGVDEISGVHISDSQNFNQITFQTNETVGEKFAELTAKNVGQAITIKLCGEVISTPVVQSMILGGGMALAGFTETKAKEVGDILAGLRPCPNE